MSDEVKKGQVTIDTHEKFMREASKQMVENLNEIKKSVKTIQSWVVFFGIITLISLVLSIFI